MRRLCRPRLNSSSVLPKRASACRLRKGHTEHLAATRASALQSSLGAAGLSRIPAHGRPCSDFDGCESGVGRALAGQSAANPVCERHGLCLLAPSTRESVRLLAAAAENVAKRGKLHDAISEDRQHVALVSRVRREIRALRVVREPNAHRKLEMAGGLEPSRKLRDRSICDLHPRDPHIRSMPRRSPLKRWSLDRPPPLMGVEQACVAFGGAHGCLVHFKSPLDALRHEPAMENANRFDGVRLEVRIVRWLVLDGVYQEAVPVVLKRGAGLVVAPTGKPPTRRSYPGNTLNHGNADPERTT